MSTSGIGENWNPHNVGIRRGRLKEKTKPMKTFRRTMALSFGIGFKIKKFDNENIVVWKEMMKDVLII